MRSSQFYFVGNCLAVDFVNSALSDPAGENISAWAVQAGLIDQPQAWSSDGLAYAAGFREALRAMIERLSRREELDSTDLDLINGAMRNEARSVRITRGAEGYSKHVEIKVRSAGDILVPVAESFADLLCFGNTDYLRKCESPQCVLYFYDISKNRRRRWCNMAVCGNREKASKFYKRKKSEITA